MLICSLGSFSFRKKRRRSGKAVPPQAEAAMTIHDSRKAALLHVSPADRADKRTILTGACISSLNLYRRCRPSVRPSVRSIVRSLWLGSLMVRLFIALRCFFSLLFFLLTSFFRRRRTEDIHAHTSVVELTRPEKKQQRTEMR